MNSFDNLASKFYSIYNLVQMRHKSLIIKLLLLASICFLSVSVTAQNLNNELIKAVKNNKIEKVKSLVKKQADVNAHDENGASVLMWAAYKANFKIFKYLVAKKADYTKKGVIYITKDKSSYYGGLMAIASAEDNIELLFFLLRKCKINVDDKEFNVEAQAEDGWTALQWAAFLVNNKMLEFLIENGADINNINHSDKSTPLIFALKNNKVESAKILINRGANITIQEASGWKALHYAAIGGHDELVKLLIDKSAKLNVQGQRGFTPLILAAYRNEFKTCFHLLENGANKDLKDNSGKKAEDYASENGNEALFNYLSGKEKYSLEKIDKVRKSGSVEKGFSYYNNAKYKQAALEFERSLPALKEQLGENDTSYYAKIILYAGMSNTSASNLEKGLEHYLQAMAIYKTNNTGTDNSWYSVLLNNLARLYSSMHNYKEAEPLYIEAKNMNEKLFGKENINYGMNCSELADLYVATDKHKQAGPLYLEAKNSYKRTFGVEHTNYTELITKIGLYYYNIGKFKLAETHYLEGKAIAEKIVGKQHANYAVSCANLASLYQAVGEFEKAKALYVETLEIEKNVIGTEDPSYATTCDRAATLYVELKNYKEAQKLFLEAKRIRANSLGTSHTLYILTCSNLADLYFKTRNYIKAESLYLEILKVYEIEQKINHVDYANICNELALVYKNIGEYSEAEILFIKAKSIYKKKLGKQHLIYAISCNNLAELYRVIGDFRKAEVFYHEAKEIHEQFLDIQHIDYGIVCNNLALLYSAMGNYQKAELLFLTARKIYEKEYGTNHPQYSINSNNLGLLYYRSEHFFRAEQLFLEAIKIRKEKLGNEDPQYATSCNNIGLLYSVIENHKDAAKYFIEAKNIYEKAYGKNHRNYAISCGNLARTYSLMIDSAKNDIERLEIYKKAEGLHAEVKAIRAKVLGKKHPEYALSCDNYARFYEIIGETSKTNEEKISAYQKAEALYLETNAILEYLSKESAKFMSEKERRKYLEVELNQYFANFHSFYLQKQSNNEKLVGTVYNNALSLKGQLLKSAIVVRKAIFQSGDTTAINLYNEMSNYSKLLAKQYALPTDKRIKNVEQLAEKVNLLEKELTRKSQEYKNLSSKGNLSWKDIQASLKDDETAIEFIHFDYQKNMKWTGDVLYFALVLQKGFEYPKAVYLFKEKQLQKLLKRKENESDYNFVKKLYSHGNKSSDSLYNIVFKPLEEHLNTTKTIYVSPTGLLNRVAFDALVCDSLNILSDKFNVYYTSSTSVCANNTGLYSKDINNVALFGGIDYSLSSEEMLKNAASFIQQKEPSSKNEIDDVENYKNKHGLDSLNRNISWSYLPGSLEETEEIKLILEKNNINVKLYKDELGNEEQFKALENNIPSIIHVSTHGYYFGFDKKSDEYRSMLDDKVKFAYSSNPLIRSGFILAGGNAAFQGKDIPVEVEDGVLTAAEISNLNFYNTKVVVLSACQTGLGEVKGSEGVYGLQRSFKMAGVEYLLFSLWEVPDYQTRELMAEFYKNWLQGMEIRPAFKKAQEYLKTEYAEAEGAAFSWAAFVLIK